MVKKGLSFKSPRKIAYRQDPSPTFHYVSCRASSPVLAGLEGHSAEINNRGRISNERSNSSSNEILRDHSPRRTDPAELYPFGGHQKTMAEKFFKKKLLGYFLEATYSFRGVVMIKPLPRRRVETTRTS